MQLRDELVKSDERKRGGKHHDHEDRSPQGFASLEIIDVKAF
jgi:hypothetical protein